MGREVTEKNRGERRAPERSDGMRGREPERNIEMKVHGGKKGKKIFYSVTEKT